MLALLKKEISSFLSSLIGYIVLVVFLLLIGLFSWVFGSTIIDSGEARLDPLFQLAPSIFIFLIPAITMRSFSEEKRIGTMEILYTKPITDLQIILSKYFASLILVIFSILPTLVYFYTISKLGDPPGNVDYGGTIGSYIGLLFLGAGFSAIGIFCSSITKNQIVAWLLGAFLCFFIWLGFGQLASFQELGSFDSIVIWLGIEEHYRSMSRGVIDTRDVIYFISLITFFILLSKLVLESRKW